MRPRPTQRWLEPLRACGRNSGPPPISTGRVISDWNGVGGEDRRGYGEAGHRRVFDGGARTADERAAGPRLTPREVGFTTKYRELMARANTTREQFAQTYSQPIRIRPTRCALATRRMRSRGGMARSRQTNGSSSGPSATLDRVPVEVGESVATRGMPCSGSRSLSLPI